MEAFFKWAYYVMLALILLVLVEVGAEIGRFHKSYIMANHNTLVTERMNSNLENDYEEHIEFLKDEDRW